METENKIYQLKQALDNATAQLSQAKQLLAELGAGDLHTSPTVRQRAEQVVNSDFEGNSQVIEGIFNGQNMVGPDGKIYAIPANYVSKSKLVEGDLLKLTIRPDGSFIYKQIGPVERKRMVGVLVHDVTSGDYTVVVGDRSYKVIMASVTYFKGEPGNEVVILTPLDADSSWAAVENIVHQQQTTPSQTEPLELTSGSDAELPSGAAAEIN